MFIRHYFLRLFHGVKVYPHHFFIFLYVHISTASPRSGCGLTSPPTTKLLHHIPPLTYSTIHHPQTSIKLGKNVFYVTSVNFKQRFENLARGFRTRAIVVKGIGSVLKFPNHNHLQNTTF